MTPPTLCGGHAAGEEFCAASPITCVPNSFSAVLQWGCRGRRKDSFADPLPCVDPTPRLLRDSGEGKAVRPEIRIGGELYIMCLASM